MKDKQIEEMAKIIGDNTEQDTMWSEIYDCANALYNAGYRKASDVAEEIFAEIYKALNNSVKTELFKGTWFDYSKFITEVDKLKKKYTEVTEWREDIEKSPVDCSTPSVTDSKGDTK